MCHVAPLNAAAQPARGTEDLSHWGLGCKGPGLQDLLAHPRQKAKTHGTRMGAVPEASFSDVRAHVFRCQACFFLLQSVH